MTLFARYARSACVVLLLGICLSGRPVQAQFGGPNPDSVSGVTLPVAVGHAVAWHPAIDEAVGQLNASIADVETARAAYSPQISGGGTFGLDPLNGLRWRPRAELTISQLIFDFGKTADAVAAAHATTQVSRAQLLLAVDGLLRNVSYAFVEMQRYQALLDIAQQQLTSVTAISELVAMRASHGASTRSDALQAQSRVQSAQSSVQQIGAQLERWRSNLGHLMGVTRVTSVVAELPVWSANACDREIPDWTQVPAVLQSEAARDVAAARLRAANAKALPTISLGADIQSDVRQSIHSLSAGTDVNIGVNVSSSLFDGGANAGRRRSAAFAMRSAEASVDTAYSETGRTLQEAREQVAGLRLTLATLGERQETIRQTGYLYRLQYLELGTRSLIDLLNAEQEINQARLDRANTEHDLRRLSIDCSYASGGLRAAFDLTGSQVRGVTL